MLRFINLTLFVVLTYLGTITSAAAVNIGRRAPGSIDTLTSPNQRRDGDTPPWEWPVNCADTAAITDTDQISTINNYDYLIALSSPDTDNWCNIATKGCVTVACTNVGAGRPGDGGSSIVQVCNDNNDMVTPTCYNVGWMAKTIVENCQKGTMFGTDGSMYDMTSGQLFDFGGWNVIVTHQNYLCSS